MTKDKPIITKSKLGDLWKIETENKVQFMNQKRLEEYLKKLENEEQG